MPLCRFFETDLDLISANVSEEWLRQVTNGCFPLVDKEEKAELAPLQVFEVEEGRTVVEC